MQNIHMLVPLLVFAVAVSAVDPAAELQVVLRYFRSLGQG